MSVPYTKDDYVVIQNGTKQQLAIVLNKNQVMLEEGSESDDTTTTLPLVPEDILMNIGPEPKHLYGKKVLGRVAVNIYQATMTVGKWCPVHLYIEWKDERENKYFVQVMKKMYSRLKEFGLQSIVENMSYIKLMPKSGRYAGSYTHKKNKDGTVEDHMKLMPEDFKDRKYLYYVVAHECGHGVWFNLVPEDIKARWTRLFSKRICVDHFDQVTMERLRDSLLNYEGGIDAYKKEIADEDDKALIKECLAWIKRVHKIGQKEFEQLCVLDAAKAYENHWPDYADLGTPEFDVTEYSMTKVDELFAESFAYYIVGKKLPKDITKAMEKTLKAARRH